MPWRHKQNTSDIPTSGTNAPLPGGGIKRLRTSNHEVPSPHLLHPCVCLQSGSLEFEIFIWPDRSDEILHLFITGWWRAAWRGIIPCWHNAFCFGTLSLSNLNCVLVPSSAQCWGFMDGSEQPGLVHEYLIMMHRQNITLFALPAAFCHKDVV